MGFWETDSRRFSENSKKVKVEMWKKKKNAEQTWLKHVVCLHMLIAFWCRYLLAFPVSHFCPAFFYWYISSSVRDLLSFYVVAQDVNKTKNKCKFIFQSRLAAVVFVSLLHISCIFAFFSSASLIQVCVCGWTKTTGNNCGSCETWYTLPSKYDAIKHPVYINRSLSLVVP